MIHRVDRPWRLNDKISRPGPVSYRLPPTRCRGPLHQMGRMGGLRSETAHLARWVYLVSPSPAGGHAPPDAEGHTHAVERGLGYRELARGVGGRR